MTDHQAKYLEEAGQQLRRQGFTVCPEHAGPLSSGALFTPEQLAEMYRCIHETLDGPYNVSAKYSGTVSRIALDRVRYVAIFERTTFVPEELPPEDPGDPAAPELEAPAAPGEMIPPEDSAPGFHFNWAFLLIPLAVVAIGGGGLGIALFLRRRSESREETH